MLRVIIADDLEESLDWMRSVLARNQQFQVVAEARGGEEAVRLVESGRPELVIADIDMPDLDGFDLTRHITSRWPDVKVILISSHTDSAFTALAMEEGALAFIPKGDFSISSLCQALKEAS